MPKTFPLRLEVEEIALGTVLRKLNDMPGIVKLDLDLGHGGQGPGRKQLEAAARTVNNNNGSREPIVIKLLMEGPKHIREISGAIGGTKQRAYGLMNQLHKKGLTKTIGKGMHQLTTKAMAQLRGGLAVAQEVHATAPALPAPKVKRGPAGRASPGSGPIILRTVLNDGPAHPSDVRKALAEKGMSSKSISGVLDRAKRNGLVKKNGADFYELTAKGQKIEMLGASHG